MRIKILCFGALRERCGPETAIEMADGANVADAISRLPVHPLIASCATAVNQKFASRDCVLHDGDEVALLPPVSGGAA